MGEFSLQELKYQIESRNEDSLIIHFQGESSSGKSRFLSVLKQNLQQELGSRILDIVPSYSSLFIQYHLVRINLWDRRSLIDGVIQETMQTIQRDCSEGWKVFRIPVCYDPAYGLDLKRISDARMIPIEDIVALHSGMVYPVYAVGFTPGFTYLGDVDTAIEMGRLSSPRLNVPAGSVGIADRQTGIYPVESPGGWNIIGRTPLNLFDVKASQPNLLQVGDFIQFVPIKADEFRAYEGVSFDKWEEDHA